MDRGKVMPDLSTPHSEYERELEERSIVVADRPRVPPSASKGDQTGAVVSGQPVVDNFGIKSRRWIVRRSPFKHMIVHDLFEASVLERLKASFRERVQDGGARRSRIANYDATVLPLNDTDRISLAPFLDFEWLRLISKAMGVDPCFEVDGALHSHPSGSRSGWIHNDYNPGWFARSANDREVYLNSSDVCDYKTGKTPPSSGSPVRRMRYLTLIYYLENPPWVLGMGGETGIYLSQRQPVDQADVFVPPRENTLLVFECTPHSWHSFRTTGFRRNSLTLWLHRDFEQAKQQWPHHEPVYWS
jgi:hypothetical protein